MDLVVVAIAAGLTLRLLLSKLDPLAALSPALTGIWEGFLVHRLAPRSSSLDHYLAYGLRLFVDLLFTASYSRLCLVLLWTGFGMVVAEATTQSHGSSLKRKRRHSSATPRSAPAHVRIYKAPSNPPTRERITPQPMESKHRPITPLLSPTQSPTPPSSFLEGPSDRSFSPSPIPMHLPTPPETVPDGQHSVSEAHSRHRLSTVTEEVSPMLDPLSPPDANHIVGSYAPSVATSAALPVPSAATIQYNQAHQWRPGTPSDRDELRTPNQGQWDLDDRSEVDELTTPLTHRRVLSPLPLDDLRPGFVLESQPFVGTSSHILNPVDSMDVASFSKYTILLPPSDDTHDDHNAASDPESLRTQTEASSVISNLNPGPLNSKAEELRRQARDLEKTRSRLQANLKDAVREGRVKDAFLLRGDIRDAEDEAQKIHSRAAKRYYIARNQKRKPDTIDVHGLRVSEAILRIEKAFRDTLMNQQSCLKVIVGKGIHSTGGIPVLKLAVIREMELQKIPCTVDLKNPGMLILTPP